MGRWIALTSEITGRSHNALTEVALPDAIDHHARQQWLIGISEPQRESLSPLRDEQNTLWLLNPRPRIQRGRKARLHLLTLGLPLTLGEDVRIRHELLVGQNDR